MVEGNSLWLVVTWKGDVLHTSGVTQGQCFSLGSGAADWPFPAELLGASSRLLADYRGTVPKVWLAADKWITLEAGQRQETHFGPFCVAASFASERVTRPADLRPSPPVRSSLFWLGSAIAQVSLLLAALYATPELGDIEASLPQAPPVISLWLSPPGDPREPPDEDAPIPGVAATKTPFIERVAGAPMHCTGYAWMGKPLVAEKKRYGVTGPRDNPDPHLSHRRALVDSPHRTQPALGVLPILGDAKAPTAPWARDTSLGTDEVSARGSLWEDTVGNGVGDDDLGVHYVDGGLLKRVDVERPQPGQQNRPPRVVHTRSSVQGALNVSEAELVLATRLAAFRECYKADPSSHGQQEATLELGLDIDSTGMVRYAKVLNSTAVAPTLMGCVVREATRLGFPPQSGNSQIRYPLQLIPSVDQDSPPVRSIPLAPPIAREPYPGEPCSGTRPPRAEPLRPCPR